jgi:cytochrome c553
MSRGFFTTMFGVALIAVMAVAPANAADDIATRVQLCGACHGQNGVPVNATTPIIRGQQSNFLYKELHDYHSGERVNLIMSAIGKFFDLDELRKVADYYAALSWPPRQATAVAPGSPPEGIAMCKACHGQNFEGGAPAPRLAGLSYEYLLEAMDSFADGKRTNNLDMPDFMKALTDSQREAIARYLSSL